ncbi:hypothetical protein [Helicobacter pylori]|nr:hypothetical protein [Helicobacter pylori]
MIRLNPPTPTTSKKQNKQIKNKQIKNKQEMKDKIKIRLKK